MSVKILVASGGSMIELRGPSPGVEANANLQIIQRVKQ